MDEVVAYRLALQSEREFTEALLDSGGWLKSVGL